MAEPAVVKVIADVSNAHSGLNKLSGTMEKFGKQNLTVNGILGQVAGTLGKFTAGMGAAEMAGKLFNSMLDNSQQFGDMVRNSIATAKTTVDVFAGSLARCNFSAFHGGLDGVISRAWQAADAMDALQNVMISSGLINAKLQARYTKLRTVAFDPDAKPEDRQKAMNGMGDVLKEQKKVNADSQQAIFDAIRKKVAAQAGVSEKDIKQSDIDRAIEIQASPAGKQELLGIQYAMGDGNSLSSVFTKSSRSLVEMYAAGQKWLKSHPNGVTNSDRIVYMMNEMADSELQQAQQLRVQSIQLDAQLDAQTYQYNKQRTRLEKELHGGGGSGRGGGGNTKNTRTGRGGAKTTTTSQGQKSNVTLPEFRSDMNLSGLDMMSTPSNIHSMSTLQNMLSDAEQMLDDARNNVEYNIATDLINDIQKQIDVQPLALRVSLDTESVAQLFTNIDDLSQRMRNEAKPLDLTPTTYTQGSKKGKKNVPAEEAKETAAAWNKAYNVVNQFGNALNNIDNKGLNIAGTIMQATANVALGFAKASAKTGGEGNLYAWIAATVAGLATMTATIATVKKQAGSYAEGGVVPGTYNGGVDDTYVYASPGEAILTRAQSSNLLGQLDAAQRGGTGEAYVRGETMYMALNNYMKRTGRKFA